MIKQTLRALGAALVLAVCTTAAAQGQKPGDILRTSNRRIQVDSVRIVTTPAPDTLVYYRVLDSELTPNTKGRQYASKKSSIYCMTSHTCYVLETATPPPPPIPTDTVKPPIPTDTTTLPPVVPTAGWSTVCNVTFADGTLKPAYNAAQFGQQIGWLGSPDVHVVKDPTGLMGGGNVAEITYTRADTMSTPDVNRSFDCAGNVGFGQTVHLVTTVLICAGPGATCAPADPARAADQRKLIYLQTVGNHSPVVIKHEGGRLKSSWSDTTAKNPTKVITSAPVPLDGKPFVLDATITMNTDSLSLNGSIVVKVNGVVVMSATRIRWLETHHPLTRFKVGQQWQSSPVDRSVGSKLVPYTEKRYIGCVLIEKQ